MCNAIDGVVAVAGIGYNGNGSARLNGEDDLCALVELRVAFSVGELTCGSVDGETVPLGYSALNVFHIGVGSTASTLNTVEVVVCSVILDDLGGLGIPRIEVSNVAVYCAEDN